MSGFWETLFRDEPQGWSACIVNHLDYYVGLLVALPGTIVALILSLLVIVWDFTCAQARAVSDLLQLDEWWTLEHSVFTFLLTASLLAILGRNKGTRLSLLCQIGVELQLMATFGCFVWLAAGLQGGVVFGGKFFFPTLALLSLAFQVTRGMQHLAEKEMYGYVEKSEDSSENAAKVFRTVSRFVCLKSSLCLCVATFGLPRDGDYLPLISLLPAVGFVRLILEYCRPEVVVITDNGSATKLPAEEEPAEEAAPVAEEEAPVTEEPAPVEAEKEEETKAVEETATPTAAAADPEPETAEEKKPEEPVKTSLCVKARNVVCCLTGAAKGVAGKVLNVAVGASQKVVSLPWNFIIESTASVGTTAAMAFAYWTLTEDHAVWLMPLLTQAVPLLAGKAESKNLLTGRTVFIVKEASHVVMAATQYYLFRSYISLPF